MRQLRLLGVRLGAGARRLLLLMVTAGTTMAIAMSTDDVAACSCMPPGEPLVELDKSVAVFEARVDSVSEAPSSRFSCAPTVSGSSIARMTVLRAWKGTRAGAHVELVGAPGCSYTFTTGQSYVVYANGREQALSASLCSRTTLSLGAQSDFDALGPPSR